MWCPSDRQAAPLLCPLSGVSRLSTQDVGLLLHLLKEKKQNKTTKGQPSITHFLSPSSYENNRAPPNIPLSFPKSLGSLFPQCCPVVGRRCHCWPVSRPSLDCPPEAAHDAQRTASSVPAASPHFHLPHFLQPPSSAE